MKWLEGSTEAVGCNVSSVTSIFTFRSLKRVAQVHIPSRQLEMIFLGILALDGYSLSVLNKLIILLHVLCKAIMTILQSPRV